MRSLFRIVLLAVILVVLVVPLAAQASGPCPDDPVLSKECVPEAPPFFVVTNRSFEDLDRTGSGCQPIILDYSDCEDCCGDTEVCITAVSMDMQTRVCPLLAERVEWTEPGQTELVYEMCCDCSTSAAGTWVYRVRLLDETGLCPIDPATITEDNPTGCLEGLPPGTGIDLPAPVIVGGLAVLGAGLLAAGMMVRRRSLRVA
jgi:hypothetical protein